MIFNKDYYFSFKTAFHLIWYDYSFKRGETSPQKPKDNPEGGRDVWGLVIQQYQLTSCQVWIINGLLRGLWVIFPNCLSQRWRWKNICLQRPLLAESRYPHLVWTAYILGYLMRRGAPRKGTYGQGGPPSQSSWAQNCEVASGRTGSRPPEAPRRAIKIRQIGHHYPTVRAACRGHLYNNLQFFDLDSSTPGRRI